MKTPFDNKCCKCEGCHNCDCNNTGTFEFYMEPALYNFAKKMTHEMDSCPPEELCQPCWDNCRCMDEILIDRKKIEHLTEDVTELSDRTVKVEKRFKDVSDNISQQIGELARKEQNDVDCLNMRIDNEIERATNREDQIDAKLDQEIARATAAENDLNNALAAEIDRATTAEQGIAGDLAAEVQRATNEESRIETSLNTSIQNEVDRATTAEASLLAKINKEIQDRIDDVDAEEARATTAEGALQTALTAETTRATTAEGTIATNLATEINDRKEDAVASVDYDSSLKRIIFKNYKGDTIDYLDATLFVKDGMINSVEISGRNLVITWNTDAGHSQTIIALDDIFNPDNYYTKTASDQRYYTKTEIDTNIYTKAQVNTTVSRIDGDIAAEVARATAAEGALGTRITNEIATERARATAAETGLSSDISDEATARAAADTTLTNNLAAANTRIDNLSATVAQTVNNNTTLGFGQTKNIAKVNGVDISVGLPSLPTAVDQATKDGDGNTITATYVTALGTNGNNITWTKGGTTNQITVPYATKATQDANGDTITSTYLKQADAASTYLTQANAASTYLTQTNAANTYSTKSHTIKDVTLDGNYLKLWLDDGTTDTCPLPTALIDVSVLNSAVSNLVQRVTALESMWEANSTTHTLSPKSPYTNVSMGGNLTVGGTASVTGNTSLSNVSASGTLSVGSTATITGNTTVSGSVTGAGFYDSLIS